MTDLLRMDLGVDRQLTEGAAREWASRRWACEAETEVHPHPHSLGDWVATIMVRDHSGQQYRGIGYSGMAPLGFTMWWKAAVDLVRHEPKAEVAK